MLRQWYHKLYGKGKKTAAKARIRRRSSSLPLRLEALEDRITPSTIADYVNQPTLPSNMHLLGSAYLTYDSGNGYITLTPPQLDQLGSVTVDSTGNAVQAFHATLDISLKDSNTSAPADGMSFGYGPLSGNPFGETGEVSDGGLWFSVNTFGSPGLHVYYGGNQIYDEEVTDDATNINADLRGSWNQVNLSMDASGVLTVQYLHSNTGSGAPYTSILDTSIQVPNWNPQSNWQFGAGARTGAGDDRQVVEDMDIEEDPATTNSPVTAAVPAGTTTIYPIIYAPQVSFDGPGTAVLSGIDTSVLNVQSGTVVAPPDTIDIATEETCIGDGATLQMSTTLQSATVNVQGGGTLTGGTSSAPAVVAGNIDTAPGALILISEDPATFTVNGNLNASAGSSIHYDVWGMQAGSSYDQLVVNGTANINGVNLVVNLGSFNPAPGEQFVILKSTNPIQGTFAGLPEGASLYVNGQLFHITYKGGNGDDVVLVAPVQPTLSISDGGTYNGSGFQASGTATGLNAQSVAGNFNYTYYAGNTPTGTGSSTPPTNAGTYTVVAAFTPTDLLDYISNTAQITFTIAKATPTVSVSDASGTYNGSAFPATATVTGVDGTAVTSLEGMGLTYDYQQLDSSGNVIKDLGSSAPVNAGSYKVTASFAGSADYNAASQTIAFTINPAAPTVSVTDAGGTYNGSAFPATATTSEGKLFVANEVSNTVSEVSPSGSVSTFVSNGLDDPTGLTFNANGDLFVANLGNGTISEVTPLGSVSTFATGLNSPYALAFNANGDLFVSDEGNNTVSELSLSGNIINTFSGFNVPRGLAFNASGDLFVSDPGDNTIEEVTPSGNVSTFASIEVSSPSGLAFDASGNLFAAMDGYGTVNEVSPSGSTIFAASGINLPRGLAFNASGNLFVANQGSNTISEVTPSGSVSTFVNNGLNNPVGLAFQPAVNGSFSYAYYAGTDTSGSSLGATAPTNAGTYTVVATFTSSDPNYTNGSAQTTFTIAKAVPTVSVSDAGGTYKGKAFAASDTVAGVVAGVDSTPSASLEGVSPTLTYYSGTYTTVAQLSGLTALSGAPINAGSYTVLASFIGSTDYTGATALANFTISPATLTVTANNVSRIYGMANPTFTYTFTGFVNGETDSVVSGSPSLTTTATASSAPNTYTITAAQGTLTAANYIFSMVNGTLTVTAAPLAASSVNFSATAGAPFSGTVATFTNADPFGSAASYTALISWGDGSTSYGVISGTGTLIVSGSHTFADPVNETVSVQISHNLGYTTTATVSDSATVASLGQGVQSGEGPGVGFWHNKNGQALISSFNGGSSSTTLADWLATTFPNLYGVNAGSNNLTDMTNTQVAAFYLSLFNESGSKLDAQVLATALNVYATTLALGGAQGQVYGFLVDAYGLGARSYNIGSNGAAFGVADNTTLNVYEILRAANAQAVNGLLYGGNSTLQNEALNVFGGINQTGGI